MAPGGLARLCMPVHLPPAAHDPLHVGGRALPPHDQQSLFSLGCGHAGKRSDLGVRQLAARECLGHERQRAECVRDPDSLSRGTQVEADAPRQPLCARAEARVPTRPRVELADQVEKPRGRGVEVRRQLGDLVAQPIELCVIDFHGESPISIEATLHHDFRGLSDRAGRTRRRREMIFGQLARRCEASGSCGPHVGRLQSEVDAGRSATTEAVK